MARKEHYKAQYDKCCGNTNEKWRFVMSFIKNDTNGSDEKIHLGHDGDRSISVADKFNDFFINVRTNLAENHPTTATKFTKYFPKIDNAFAAEFSFTEIETAASLKITDSFSNK
jgi:hypothetical protein